MRYVKARYKQYVDSLTYRIYISDSIYQYTDGKRITKRYADTIFHAKEDSRTGDEIAFEVIANLRLKVKQ